MAKVYLGYKDIVDIIWGATLLGGGGGGSMKNGLDMLDAYVRDHCAGDTSKVKLEMVDVEDMEPGVYGAVTAGMGAPTVLKETDFSEYALNTFKLLQTMAAEEGKKIGYSMAVEIGGFNTFVPMLISLRNGIPFVNTDGAARAVPALDTLLLHVNGNNTSPLAMSNANKDEVRIILTDAKDAKLAENVARGVTVAFGYMAGLCGWMLEKKAIAETLPKASVELCRKVGIVLRDKSVGDKFKELSDKGILKAKLFAMGPVTAGGNSQVGGFDIGYVEVGGKARVDFQNENLVLSDGQGKIGKVFMTAPDIICSYNTDDGHSLTNADYFDEDGKLIKQNVAIGCVQVDPVWWKTGDDRVLKVWSEYFSHVGYTGGLVKYA
jgi:DUF917 family protein